MKGIAILAGAAAMLALAGCNRAGTNANATANASAGNAAKPADAGTANQAATQTADAGKLTGGGAIPASSSGAVTLDRTFMMGRWTDDNDCSNAIAFNQDGGFVTASGGTGLWNLDGDRLTLSGNQTATIRVVPIDQNTMTVVNADGSLGRSTRC